MHEMKPDIRNFTFSDQVKPVSLALPGKFYSFCMGNGFALVKEN